MVLVLQSEDMVPNGAFAIVKTSDFGKLSLFLRLSVHKTGVNFTCGGICASDINGQWKRGERALSAEGQAQERIQSDGGR